MSREDRFNVARVVLAANGFNCSGLRGIRFAATHETGSTVEVELRPRTHIKSDNMYMDLFMCFPVRGEWYLLPHDRLVEIAGETTSWLETYSWRVAGEYNSENPSGLMMHRLEEYRIGVTGSGSSSSAIEHDPGWNVSRLLRMSSMLGNRWTREENLAVLYMRHIGLSYSDPAIEELAGAMNRTVASVWMRRGNFDSLDTSVRGLGLSSVSQLTRSIWADYQQDPAGVLAEAREVFFSLLGDYAPVEPTETPVESEPSLQHGLSATVRYAGPSDQSGTVPISSQDNVATPLHDAARMGYADIVRALVSAGADLHALDENGHTPDARRHQDGAHRYGEAPHRSRIGRQSQEGTGAHSSALSCCRGGYRQSAGADLAWRGR